MKYLAKENTEYDKTGDILVHNDFERGFADMTAIWKCIVQKFLFKVEINYDLTDIEFKQTLKFIDPQ